MKILGSISTTNCTIVAAALSTLYRTYDRNGFSSVSSSSSLLTSSATTKKALHDDEDRSSSASSLEDFLDHNGILLTMCMSYRGIIPWLECSRPTAALSKKMTGVPLRSASVLVPPPTDDTTTTTTTTSTTTTTTSKASLDPSRLEASWVQQDQTRGFRVIGQPIDLGPPVGYVLHPSKTRIRCIYPADGGTDGRDDSGCGPFSTDPQYGSNGYDHSSWYQKMILRAQMVHYKNSLFGRNSTWDSISCVDFFNHTRTDMPIIGFVDTNSTSTTTRQQQQHSEHHQPWRYQTQESNWINNWSYIMGHPICNRTGMPPDPSPDFGTDYNNNTNNIGTKDNKIIDLVYLGPFSWSTREWDTVLSLMQSAIDHPAYSNKRMGIFNELVLAVPIDRDEFTSTVVQAVFYIKGISGIVVEEMAYRIAKRQAKLLHKPLLYVDLSSNTSYGHDDGMGASTTTTSAYDDIFHCAETLDDADDADVDQHTSIE